MNSLFSTLDTTTLSQQTDAELSHYIDNVGVVVSKLTALFDKFNVCKSHGMEHSNRVYQNALGIAHAEKEKPTYIQIIMISLASLLHDADDGKFFKNNNDCENAREILKGLFAQPHIDIVIAMIKLVSASKNGNTSPDKTPRWMLIPRIADRLEAIGVNGVLRAYEYTLTIGSPIYTSNTFVPMNVDDLYMNIATVERTLNYTKNQVKSPSLIDHYYDKLLRLMYEIDYDNKFVMSNLKKSNDISTAFVMLFAENIHNNLAFDDKVVRNFITLNA